MLPRDAALEAAVRNDGDDATWSIYSDFLQQHGAPLGRAIAAELAGHGTATETGRALLEPALETALREAETGYAQNTDYVMWPPASFRVEWKRGFMEHVRLEEYPARTEDHAPTHATLDDLLAAVLASPTAMFLRSLTLGLWSFDALPSYARTLALLWQHRSLRKLSIGDVYHPYGERGDDPMDRWAWSEIGGSLVPVWETNLESFAIRGLGIELGTPASDRLTELVIEAPDLDERASLATARLPALRTLRVFSGWRDEQARLDDVMQLAARSKLRDFGFGGCRNGDAVLAAITSHASAFDELVTLRLHECGFTAAQVDTLVALRPHLPALRELDLSENHALWHGYGEDVEAPREELERVFPTVIYGDE